MCGRYFFAENIDMKKYVKILEQNYDQLTLDLLTFGQIKPSNVVLTFVKDGPDLAKWGYSFNHHNLINIRYESILTSMIKKEECNRIIIPANGFYEWDSNKQKFFYHLEDEMLYMAGIYQNGTLLKNFSIITKPATDTIAIHDRVPVVLIKQQAYDYLNEHFEIKDLPKENPKFQLHTDYENISLF